MLQQPPTCQRTLLLQQRVEERGLALHSNDDRHAIKFSPWAGTAGTAQLRSGLLVADANGPAAFLPCQHQQP